MPALVDTSIRLLAQEPLAGPDADGGAAAPCGDPRQGRFRLPRGLGRRRLRHGRAPRRREPVGADPRAERAHRDAARDGAARPVPRRLAARWRRVRQPLRRLGRREWDRGLPPARSAERRRESPRGRRGDHERRQGVRCGARVRLRLHERDRRAGRAGKEAPSARRLARAAARPVELAPAAASPGACRDTQGGERPAGRALLPGRRRERDGHRASRPRAPEPTSSPARSIRSR